MSAKTVRDVQRPGFIKYLAIYMYRNNILQSPLISTNPESARKFEKFRNWWFAEGARLILQWYEAPSLPPPIPPRPTKDMTKKEREAIFMKNSIVLQIKQFVELGWIIRDRTGIMIVTDLGREQLDFIATQYKQYRIKEDAKLKAQAMDAEKSKSGKDSETKKSKERLEESSKHKKDKLESKEENGSTEESKAPDEK